MPVWRVHVREVVAKRSEKLPKSLKIEVVPKVGDAKVEKVGDAKLIKVEYSLKAKYSNAAEIEVKGHMYLIGHDESIIEDGVIKDANVVKEVYQRIFFEPMVVAINMAKELNLPLPVKMPEVVVEKKE